MGGALCSLDDSLCDQRPKAFEVDLVQVGAATVFALGRFEDHGNVDEARVVDEVSNTLPTN